jgi:light-regulated signal transduction histidine kinase (bacteriophytochrome)
MRTVQTIEALTLDEGDLLAALPEQAERLADFVRCGGFALAVDGGVTSVGATPDTQAVLDLVGWLSRRVDGPIWATDSLAEVYPPAQSLLDTGDGLLAVQVATLGSIYLLWFRPEQVREVSWGGDPEKERRFTPPGARLHPRKSFEIWKETVRGRAVAWLPFEVDAARELRTALLNVVLRHATEVELLNRELARSNDELDAFAYVASHDLKEPLRGIHNYSVMMMEDLGDDLPADGRRRLEAIARLTQRMEALLDSLLKYSRLGRHELSMNPVDLGAVLADVRATVEARLQETGATLVVADTLPSVGGDPILLHELLVNLVSNAIEYNDKPERRVEVGVAPAADPAEAPADEVVLFVRDNGIGIPPARFESIFQIFRRLHARTAYGGGTGVGLTIARKIVERHGGRIWLDSSVGEGSTFYVALPRPGAPA